MTRAQLEHIIRAACAVADDVYPKNHPERADLIDGALGELSMFHSTFGYYADGVSESTATLPSGWRQRLVPICNDNTLGRTGWCLEVHDLLVSKYVAGRAKDLRFTATAARRGLANRVTLLDRLGSTDVVDAVRKSVHDRIERDFGGS